MSASSGSFCPIIGPASSTKLDIQLRIPEFQITRTFTFHLLIDETDNNINRGPCPYPSTVPCSDKITFDDAGIDIKNNFKIGNVDYTLQLTGFKESRVSTSFPTSQFISNEQRENNAFLFARIVAGCPEICADGSMVDIVTVNGVKTCGCNCGSKTCTPPQVLQKDCNCECPPGTCNGAPTDAQCNCQCPTPASAGFTCAPPKSGWDTTRCECKCDDDKCGAGTIVDPTSCRCDCAAVSCPNGRVADPENKCECRCLAQCGPTQRKVEDNNRCECQCDPTKTQCAQGFTLEIDPSDPTRCRCGCANVCGAGCGLAGSVKQCNDGPAQPCCSQCTFKPLSCDDNNKCTKDDTCDVTASLAQSPPTSVCRGVSKCPTPVDTCTFYECDPAVGDCKRGVREAGAPCGPTGSDPQTWDLCRRRCDANGRCVEQDVVCQPPAGTVVDQASCDAYSCDPKDGVCRAGPKPGKSCNDGDPCTLNDICKATASGVVQCQGELDTCEKEKKDPVTCHDWKCTREAGACVKVPSPFKTPCGGDGTNACEVEGICSGGICLFDRKCERFTGEDGFCAENVCDPLTGQCTNRTRPVGSACILDNGRPRGNDFCGGNYTCRADGLCKGDTLAERRNHSQCGVVPPIDVGTGDTAALVVGLSAAAAILVMIIVAALLCAFINKSQLTDPSTWGYGADGAVNTSPLYDASAGGQVNALYES